MRTILRGWQATRACSAMIRPDRIQAHVPTTTSRCSMNPAIPAGLLGVIEILGDHHGKLFSSCRVADTGRVRHA